MTFNEFDLFLTAGFWLCVVMSGVSFLRWRSRRWSALFLGLAFLAMAGLLHGLRVGLPEGWIIALGALMVLFLMADYVSRTGRTTH
jgi:NADH:ubiquinone oxidoreductase subunit 6 (subunit J)